MTYTILDINNSKGLKTYQNQQFNKKKFKHLNHMRSIGLTNLIQLYKHLIQHHATYVEAG